jgi:hypothetical protein
MRDQRTDECLHGQRRLRLRLNSQSEELVDAHRPQQNPQKWRKRSVDLIRGREIINDLRLVRGVRRWSSRIPSRKFVEHLSYMGAGAAWAVFEEGCSKSSSGLGE